MSAGASAASAAAAAEAARRREEEEYMSNYSSQELADDWEFKIIRSATGAFRDPTKLRAILAEESQAGWILVEKFDNQRLRLKRPAIAKKRDPELAFDPYRTTVGTSEGVLVAVVIGSILLGLCALLLTIATIKNR